MRILFSPEARGELVEADHLYVLAVAHQHRRPSY